MSVTPLHFLGALLVLFSVSCIASREASQETLLAVDEEEQLSLHLQRGPEAGHIIGKVKEILAKQLADRVTMAVTQALEGIDIGPLPCSFADGYEFVNMIATQNSEVHRENAEADNQIVSEEIESTIGHKVKFPEATFILGELNEQTSAEWVNTALAGMEFAHKPYRFDAQSFIIHALEAASVTVVGEDSCINMDLDEKEMAKDDTWTSTGSCSGKTVRISSTGKILVMVHSGFASHQGNVTERIVDVMPLAPAAEVIYGSCSRWCWVDRFSGTGDVLEECSDGSSQLREFGVKINQGVNESLPILDHSGKVCKWTARAGTMIAGHSHADSDGWDGITFLPRHLFQTRTPVPPGMQYLKIFSDKQTSCTMKDISMTLTGEGPYEYRVNTTDMPSDGALLVCNDPVGVFGDLKETQKEVQMILANCAA